MDPVYTVKEKEEKPDKIPHPLPNGLRNPYRNLRSENSQDYAQQPQRNSASGLSQIHRLLKCASLATENIFFVLCESSNPPPPPLLSIQ